MGLNLAEQETQVSFMRDSDVAEVYTTDTTVMTKLDKLVKSDQAPHWKLKAKHKVNGEVVGKTYVTHKRLVSFRADIVTRELTPEQKEAAAARMREWRERKYEKGGLGEPSETTRDGEAV